MKNIPQESPTYLGRPDGSYIKDPKEIADHLANSFVNNSSAENCNQAFLSAKSQLENNPKIRQNHNLDPINKPFSMKELDTVLANCGNSSPGPDNIPNALLKQLPKGKDTSCRYTILSGMSKLFLNYGDSQQSYQYQNPIKTSTRLAVTGQSLTLAICAKSWRKWQQKY